jgi:hypothetical protein
MLDDRIMIIKHYHMNAYFNRTEVKNISDILVSKKKVIKRNNLE